MWLGPSAAEASSAYGRAREAGMSVLRSLVVGQIASFRQCWAFRRKLAEKVGCSVRTVQRAITQAKAEGLLGTARAKPHEIPPGRDAQGPVACGWSHRWIIGWGKAGTAVRDAVAAAKARWLVKVATSTEDPPGSLYKSPEPAEAPRRRPSARPSRPEYQRRRWTPEELELELEREAARRRGPPEQG